MMVKRIVVKSCLVQKYLDQIKFGQKNMGPKNFWIPQIIAMANLGDKLIASYVRVWVVGIKYSFFGQWSLLAPESHIPSALYSPGWVVGGWLEFGYIAISTQQEWGLDWAWQSTLLIKVYIVTIQLSYATVFQIP